MTTQTAAERVEGVPGPHGSSTPWWPRCGPSRRDDLLAAIAARWEETRPWPWFAPGFEPLVAQP